MKTCTTERVLYYFYELCKIPRGSGNMEKVADYCEAFAKEHSLKYNRDNANNVIIYKPASKGYEKAQPIILQGHLDMVCQAAQGVDIDFLKDQIKPYIEGDFLKAKGTTLGADNGIAVAIVLSILESDSISHPNIEAVFTTDEEIGMIGASALDYSLLTAKRMINLDSEEEDTLTVSCAGGSDFLVTIRKATKPMEGFKVAITLKGLKGGHSGVEIDKNRVNADTLMGRLLNHLSKTESFHIISVNGGDKSNAIPNLCCTELCVKEEKSFLKKAEEYLKIIKNEISPKEEGFFWDIDIDKKAKNHSVLQEDIKDALIYILSTCANGIIDMSCEIEGLVETSLNLGILKTENENIVLQYALRSNKQTSLYALEERLQRYFKLLPCSYEVFGHYPPWEYNSKSTLQSIYEESYFEFHNARPKVQALHAGLECGVFAKAIPNFDCIAVGPDIFDVHTVNERISLKSLDNFYKLLIKVLESCN